MGTILIGNIKGPQGSQGIQGPQGPVGPVGPTGPGADIYNGLDQTEAGVAGLDSYQGRVLDQKKLDVAKVANNLTTAGEGYALDARQGKALDEKKLDVNRVANNLTTEASGYALDARQGKVLNDKLINGLSYHYGTEINVMTYNSASKLFTVPQDGMIFAQVWNEDSTIDVWFGSQFIMVGVRYNTTGYVRSYAISVRKGMTMWFGGSGSKRSCYFYPLDIT